MAGSPVPGALPTQPAGGVPAMDNKSSNTGGC